MKLYLFHELFWIEWYPTSIKLLEYSNSSIWRNFAPCFQRRNKTDTTTTQAKDDFIKISIFVSTMSFIFTALIYQFLKYSKRVLTLSFHESSLFSLRFLGSGHDERRLMFLFTFIFRTLDFISHLWGKTNPKVRFHSLQRVMWYICNLLKLVFAFIFSGVVLLSTVLKLQKPELWI